MLHCEHDVIVEKVSKEKLSKDTGNYWDGITLFGRMREMATRGSGRKDNLASRRHKKPIASVTHSKRFLKWRYDAVYNVL